MRTHRRPRPVLLVVDRDPAFRRRCRRAFGKRYATAEVDRPEKAIRAVARDLPAGLVLSLDQPASRIRLLLSYLKLWPQTRTLPVLAVTDAPLGRRVGRLRELAGTRAECVERGADPAKLRGTFEDLRGEESNEPVHARAR